MGYFSKEKSCAEEYNLACILTLPAYQRKVGGCTVAGMPQHAMHVHGQPNHVAPVAVLMRILPPLSCVCCPNSGTEQAAQHEPHTTTSRTHKVSRQWRMLLMLLLLLLCGAHRRGTASCSSRLRMSCQGGRGVWAHPSAPCQTLGRYRGAKGVGCLTAAGGARRSIERSLRVVRFGGYGHCTAWVPAVASPARNNISDE